MEILRPTPEARRDASDAPARVGLSVCCMTSGRRPALLAGVLEPFAAIADEILVAVEDERAEAVREAVDGIADLVLAYPATAPADRPIAWVFRSCAGRWIFNVDDDEVPSPRLLAELPALVERGDITHGWVARRWVYPTRNTYIASSPWGTEFQLRFVLADERFLQFSDAFHLPVVSHGPSVFVDAPLWHLDTLLNPAARRRLKAAAYERERPGMRLGGLAHNLGMYVPELHPALALEPVPPEDRAAIATALAGPGPRGRARSTEFVRATAADVDREWVGAPFPDGLYRGRLELVGGPPAFYAGAQATVDVRVTNRGDRVWRWGRDARPEIRLAYTWWQDGSAVREPAALRTALPLDLAPGATELVPVHVVPPGSPGRYELEIDVVHDGVRALEAVVRSEVDVLARRRLAVIAPPERLRDLAAQLDLPPEVELVPLLRDPADRGDYGDFATEPSLRPYLLAGTAGRGRLRTLASLARRTAVAVRAGEGHWSRPAYEGLVRLRDESDALLVVGPTWKPDSAFGREWAWVAATALLWRAGGKPVFVREDALPAGSGGRDRIVRGVLGLLRRRR